MKIVVSAGDPSGDIRAGELLQALNSIAEVSVSGLGGDNLESAGARIAFHLEDYSVMGFAEVLKSLPRLRKLKKDIRTHIERTDPDLILLVDYPGLNIPLAVWASARGYRVIYYISPQLWAWGKGRIRRIKGSVDLMITMFEFEVDFYRKHGVRAVCAGHPLADSIPPPLIAPITQKLALLPGSRNQEVSLLLEPMREAFEMLRSRGLVSRASIAVSPGLPEDTYGDVLDNGHIDAAYTVREALDGASAAVVCSGTATLETAMWGIPMVIAYRTSLFTYVMARILVRGVKNIGMANLVAGEKYFQELIQGGVTPEGIADAVKPLLQPGESRNRALTGTRIVREALGRSGSSMRAARLILEEMENA